MDFFIIRVAFYLNEIKNNLKLELNETTLKTRLISQFIRNTMQQLLN